MSGLFKRWQQRREDIAEQQRVEEIEAEQQAAAVAAEEAAQAEQQDPEDLPDPDTIEEGGSFAGFLKEGVDPLKRQQALKALWSQPQYNVTDGLSEYSLDYAAQPVLDSDVAAELAENVFRHSKAAVEKLERMAEEEEAKALAAQQAELVEQTEPAEQTEQEALADASNQESEQDDTVAAVPPAKTTKQTRNLS